MKKELIVTIVVVILSVFELQAQKGPLRGEGPILSKSFDFNDFDKIAFEDFDGKIEVEIGKPFSIKVAIDENLAPRLQVEKEATEGLLRIYLRENKNGRLYLEDTHISIKVTLPEASVISHRGNTSVKVAGIVGRYFRFENQGNGDVHLEGSIDQLDIKKVEMAV
ncbi:MAG: DUF2807 domain-containing protein [Spirosomataceae bacterium]